MGDRSFIQEHMEVVDQDGQHVGTVDHLDDDRIKLTKNDQASGGEHHWITLEKVASVDDKVRLNCSADQALGS